jgi:hypothetical protein
MTEDLEKSKDQTSTSLNNESIREIQDEVRVKGEESISQTEDLSKEDQALKRKLVR